MMFAFSRFGGLIPGRAVRAPLTPTSSIGLGIGFAILAFLLFSTMDMLVKWLSASYPIHQLLFFTALFSLLPVLVTAWRHGGLGQLGTRRLDQHLLRATCGMTAAFASMTGFSLMPMADVYALLFTTPLLITALSVPLLGERVGWRRWSAVMVGFAGVLIMLQPGALPLGTGAIAGFAAAIAAAFSLILVRRLSVTETTASIAFYPNLANLLVMGGWCVLDFTPMALTDLAIAAAAGLSGGTALLALVAAFRRVAAAIAAPFQYSQMIWGTLFGYVAFGDLPTAGVVLGGTIVVASGLFILHREVVLARARPNGTASTTPAKAAV